MSRRHIERRRYAVNVWLSGDELAEEEGLHETYDLAREDARRKWHKHRGKLRVTIFDDRTLTVLHRLDPGPMDPVYGLACNDPEHRPPSPWGGVERRRKKR